jgi:type 1 glutamine amidotransferase
MIKYILTLYLLIGLSLMGRPIKVVIIDGQNNHNWKATTPVMIEALERDKAFSVSVSTSPAKKASTKAWEDWDPKFNNYDVVLSNYNGEMWPQNVQDNLVQYVRKGGAFVVVHAANNAFSKWPEYNRMIGLGGWGGRSEKSGPYLYFNNAGKLVRDPRPGRGGSHGPQSEFLVEIRNVNHPITTGMPIKWLHSKDELYDSLRGPAENVEVLATAYSEKSKRHEPMIMTIKFGKGRVFHTPMGHADYSMKCIGFQDVLRRGTEWAATGEVSLGLSKNFPDSSQVSATP